MTGPEHYVQAENLLEHAASMLGTEVGQDGAGEMVARQQAVATMATAHAVLAVAAVLGMSAPLDIPDAQGWRDVAREPLTGPER